MKNSENEAPQKLGRTALRANIRVQSRPSRAIVGAIEFSFNFGTLPNLFPLVASTTPQILAQCRKWSFSTVSEKSVSTRNPCDISEFGCFDPGCQRRRVIAAVGRRESAAGMQAKRALTHIWCTSSGSDQASFEQVDFRASIHLPFHEFELGDLAFGLAVGPVRRDGGADRALVLRDAVGKRRDQT